MSSDKLLPIDEQTFSNCSYPSEQELVTIFTAYIDPVLRNLSEAHATKNGQLASAMVKIYEEVREHLSFFSTIFIFIIYLFFRRAKNSKQMIMDITHSLHVILLVG